MKGDLHIHTRYSDGSYSVQEVLLLAKERGLSFVSVTDHDTVAGTAEALSRGHDFGVTAIPGIEISAFDFKRGRKVHVLGYDYDLPAPRIRALCDPILAARDEMTRWQIETLRKAGYPLSLEEVSAEASSPGVLYKQHIMAALVRKGATDAIYSGLYAELFKRGGICDREIRYVDAFDALKAIKADGGLAVLAHPGQLDSYDLAEELIEAGLDGIELHHEHHSVEDHRKIRNLAARYPHLLLTGGSDDHGKLGSWNVVGDIGATAKACRSLARKPNTPYPFVVDLILEAGRRLRAATSDFIASKHKGGDHRDLVTEYDLEIQKFLIAGIREKLPSHAFIAEEGDGSTALGPEPTWIIDPIDGTVNFESYGRDYAISVAHYVDGRAAFGFVYDVAADELWVGVAGGGAWLNGRKLPRLPDEKRMKASIVDLSLNSAYLLEQKHSASPIRLAPEIKAHRSSGCASLSICRVARGDLGAYASAKLCLWDWAAALILLRETGGGAISEPLRDAASDAGVKRFFVAGRDEQLTRGLAECLIGPAADGMADASR